jgi:hypothetical protein
MDAIGKAVLEKGDRSWMRWKCFLRERGVVGDPFLDLACIPVKRLLSGRKYHMYHCSFDFNIQGEATAEHTTKPMMLTGYEEEDPPPRRRQKAVTPFLLLDLVDLATSDLSLWLSEDTSLQCRCASFVGQSAGDKLGSSFSRTWLLLGEWIKQSQTSERKQHVVTICKTRRIGPRWKGIPTGSRKNTGKEMTLCLLVKA